jgi:hypothetical protein
LSETGPSRWLRHPVKKIIRKFEPDYNVAFGPIEKKSFQEDAQFCTILATDFGKFMTWEATKAPCQKNISKIRFLSPPSEADLKL